MNPLRRVSVLFCIAILVLAAGSTGCASTSASFRNSFLPPSAPAVSENSTSDIHPPVASGLFVREMPNPLPPGAAVRPSETERRLMLAQERFDAGRKFYDLGQMEDARREFDRAVNLLLTTPENAPDRSRIERRLEQIVDAVYRFDVNGLGSGEDWDRIVYDKSPLDGMLEMTFPMDPRLKSKVVEELRATVSQLPLEESDAVLSYIHFFSSERGRKVLISGLRRSGKYKPLIQRILQEEGVPEELIYLAQAESGFQPRALSNRQAAGMWQFVQWRGREYGLNQSAGFDERLDPEKSTRAAARHLRDLYTEFGDWYLAMAAYNCGPGCVDRAVQRTGYADFWKLRDLGALPKETTNYVPLIVAMTIMAKNPKDYGLEEIDADPPLDYDTLKLEAPTSLALLADAADRSVSEIRELNPSILRSVAPAGYELRLPKGAGGSVRGAFDSIPASRRATWRIHRVNAGETLAAIAKRYRTGARNIAEVNPQTVSGPTAGDVLIIPASYSEDAGAKVKSSKSRGKKAQASRKGWSRSSKSTARNVKASTSKQASRQVYHRRASSARLKTAALRRAGND